MSDPRCRAGDKLRPVRVLAVPAEPPVTVRFLGGYLGMLTHWKGKRSEPCLGAALCPPTVHRGRSIWKGYAPVEAWNPVTECWEAYVLEVTEGLEERLNGRKIRGEVWILSRDNPKERSSPVVAFPCDKCDATSLRAAFDVKPVLQRFYHSSDFPMGVPNPVPARIYLDPVSGEAPAVVKELAAPDPADRPPTAEERADFRRRMRATLGGANGRGAR